MVKIENLEEFTRIKESDVGYVVIIKEGSTATIHTTKCKLLEELYNEDIKEEKMVIFHWFQTVSLAEKEFPNLIFCQTCKM